VLIIAFCAYSPWDFLGVYSKANSVDMYLSDGVPVSASGKVHRKEIKNNSFIYYVEDATVTCENGRFTNISFIFKLDSNFIPNYSKVNIEGVAACFNEARNEGGFDMKSYYQSLGYYFEVKEVKVNEVTSIGLNIFDGF
jgi:competence protein ComEC